MTEKQRNALLAEMTEEVGLLVLQDNYYQTLALSIGKRYAVDLLDAETRMMRYLERAGRLNRVIEFLPTDDEINERIAAKQGLTTPERAVLLAYSKMWLYDALLESNVPEDALVAGMLTEYFPKPLRQRFSEPMQLHPLRREILATHLTNALVNRVGCAFVLRMMEEADASPGDIVGACMIARDIFDLNDVWRNIDALDNRVADDVQARMFVEVTKLLERAALWILRHLQAHEANDGDVNGLIVRCRDAVQRLAPQLPMLLPAAELEALSERQRVLVDAGVDSELAVRVASGDIPAALLDIAEVAAATQRGLELVASVYFALGTQLNYGWIGERAAELPTPAQWDVIARAGAITELGRLKRALTTGALAEAPDASDAQAVVDAWRSKREGALARYAQLLTDLRAAGGASLSMLLVVVGAMATLERH